MNYLLYRWKLAKLSRQRSRIVSMYKQLYGKARKEGKSREDLDVLAAERSMETGLIDDEIEELEYRYLIELARSFLLPLPEFEKESDTWERSMISGQFRLSKKAIAELRSLVRKEQKERRELITPWIVALTGIIGALTGLIAILKT